MKKNKMYFFFAILTIIFLFSFAALCNQCGTATEEEKIDVGEEEEAEEEAEEEEEVAEEEEEEEAEEVEEEEEAEEEEEEEAEGEKEEPTISLSIYEGPTYNSTDGVCYYRIKAIVTGNPSPDVDWSKDDSDGAWGTKKTQVNLNDPDETYTLTATATNSEGTDTDSIELSWGCEEGVEEEEEEEEEPEVINLNIPIVTTEGGYIEQDGKINSGGGLFAGDSAAGAGYTGDKPVRGYVSFDITGLSGKTIDQATLTLNINTIYGIPGPAFGGIWVGVVDWGAEALVLSDFSLPQVGVQLFNMTGDVNITCDTATLKTQLQNAINDGKSRFQIRISCPGTISINNTWDGWSYLQAGVNLNIDYH